RGVAAQARVRTAHRRLAARAPGGVVRVGRAVAAGEGRGAGGRGGCRAALPRTPRRPRAARQRAVVAAGAGPLGGEGSPRRPFQFGALMPADKTPLVTV